MHNFDNRRMRLAWLLMLVYLPIMSLMKLIIYIIFL